MAWAPHEDETLALFVGRDTLAGVVEHVTRERGGAPLHFLFAYAVAHLGLGPRGLRLGLGGVRRGEPAAGRPARPPARDRRTALIATALVAGSWVFLFHGVYGRMYSLFLFLTLLAFLLLLRALDRGTWRSWAPVGRRDPARRRGAPVRGARAGRTGRLRARRAPRPAAAGRDRVRAGARRRHPFWLTDLVLAGRFDVGVGGGGAKLGGPWAVVTYLWQTAGDFSTGRWPVLVVVLLLALVGLVTVDREARALALCAIGVPVAAFLAARLGGSASPESRHLIFVLPFFAILVGVGILRSARRCPRGAVVPRCVLVVLEVSWAWHRTPQLFDWEPNKRQAARAQAERFLAETSRPDDLLFGYEPLYLGAWELNRDFPDTVLPRADATLALRTLERQAKPLGRGVWVLDASERNNLRPRLEMENRDPGPPGMFETRVFGPFLVIRTVSPWGRPTRTWRRPRRRCSSDGRSGSATPTSTCRRSSAPTGALRGYGPSLRLRSDTSR